jgi:hypothetical protein
MSLTQGKERYVTHPPLTQRTAMEACHIVIHSKCCLQWRNDVSQSIHKLRRTELPQRFHSRTEVPHTISSYIRLPIVLSIPPPVLQETALAPFYILDSIIAPLPFRCGAGGRVSLADGSAVMLSTARSTSWPGAAVPRFNGEYTSSRVRYFSIPGARPIGWSSPGLTGLPSPRS